MADPDDDAAMEELMPGVTLQVRTSRTVPPPSSLPTHTNRPSTAHHSAHTRARHPCTQYLLRKAEGVSPEYQQVVVCSYAGFVRDTNEEFFRREDR